MQHVGEIDPAFGRERGLISLENRNSQEPKVVNSWCRPLEVRLYFLRLVPHRSRVSDELNEQFFNRATDVLQIPERLPNFFECHGPQHDTGAGRSRLILVLHMIEEEEVRDDPFANRPDMLPSQRSIRLVTTDRGCTLVLVSMEVEECIDVELSKARVLPRPRLSQRRGN